MKKALSLLFIACPIWVSLAFTQTVNFKIGLRNADPIAIESTISIPERVKIHQNFLDEATNNLDPQKQIYGYIYLAQDYLKAQDYPQATRYILEAETIANKANNTRWKGVVAHLKGVVSVRIADFTSAVSNYEQAAAHCGAAGDSICLGESWEQIAAMYIRLKDFEKAQNYFDLALPLIEKYGDEVSFATALNNLGLFYFHQENYVAALPYFKRAEALYRQNRKHKEEAQVLNNQAAAYINLRRFDEALKIYDQCIRLNTEFKNYENIITNYSGLANLYEDKGDLAQAIAYLNEYYHLRDSLIGAKTHKEIADLALKYDTQQKELDLQKSQSALSASQHKLERITWTFSALVLLVLFGIWRWRVQIARIKRERAQHQKNLSELTRILLDKNTLLAGLEDLKLASELQHNASEDLADFEENLLNQRILTKEDWEGFKLYFDKAYPGYLHRLRSAYPALSNAEERLFLFIKLNLNNREAAAILGISADSVKKARNRLRHRLELDEETALDAFIRAF